MALNTGFLKLTVDVLKKEVTHEDGYLHMSDSKIMCLTQIRRDLFVVCV